LVHTAKFVVEHPTDLTADWLTGVLDSGTVTDFSFERIGTGQMSECYRITLTYADGGAGPASVVLKVAATDPSSRQTGLAVGLYEREVRFYTDVAPALSGPVARCYHAAFNPPTAPSTCCWATRHPRSSATRSPEPPPDRRGWR
jgi:Ecdysteroid kinase-like family